jgi:hypothetical protein
MAVCLHPGQSPILVSHPGRLESIVSQQFSRLSEAQIKFIGQQNLFFVGTATAHSRVNVSPKGMDSLIVLDSTRVAWLNLTGSGNETSAHIQQDPRMALMFCAFEGPPLILRLYGAAKVIHRKDPEWNELFPLFKPLPGARQLFHLTLDMVQASCGMAVPYFSPAGNLGLPCSRRPVPRSAGSALLRAFLCDSSPWPQ